MRLTSIVSWTTLVTSMALVTGPSVQATRTGVACRIIKNPISMTTQRCICTSCHVCEYNVFKLGCQIIQAPDTDLSDGSEVKAVQPTLEATDWYLTDAEITKSRGGIPRSQLQVFTGGNKVAALPSSDKLSVFNDIERSATNDTVYLAGWGVDDVPFDPNSDPTGDRSSFRSIMSRAVTRGADVRALVWRNPTSKFPAPAHLVQAPPPGRSTAAAHATKVACYRRMCMLVDLWVMDIYGCRPSKGYKSLTSCENHVAKVCRA